MYNSNTAKVYRFPNMENIENVKNVNNVENLNIIQLPQAQPKLKKDGTPKKHSVNKKKGVKSEVYPYTIEDAKKMINYFLDNGKWECYLIFILQCNTARRISDILPRQWSHFYDPRTGEMRDEIESFKEKKTDKFASPHLNSVCKNAIKLYVEKMGIDPSENNYNNYVFTQTTGKYKGNVFGEGAYNKNLKKAASDIGITYNIGSHSSRKFFGWVTKNIHPGDCNCMELLQEIFNHSDVKTTNRYIGINKQQANTYYDDMGSFFEDYILGDKECDIGKTIPVISINKDTLRDIIAEAYKLGKNNANNLDSSCHINAINTIMSKVDSAQL